MSESKTPVPPEPSGSERAEWREATENYVAWLETQLAARERELAEITAERDRLREVFQVPATVTDPLFIMDGWRDQYSGVLSRLGELERELAELRQRDTCLPASREAHTDGTEQSVGHPESNGGKDGR